MPSRPTNFPKEVILSVQEGAPCFRGFATAVREKDELQDVVVIARTQKRLIEACKLVAGPQLEVEPSSVYRIVFVQERHAKLDDEL